MVGCGDVGSSGDHWGALGSTGEHFWKKFPNFSGFPSPWPVVTQALSMSPCHFFMVLYRAVISFLVIFCVLYSPVSLWLGGGVVVVGVVGGAFLFFYMGLLSLCHFLMILSNAVCKILVIFSIFGF